ncbi:WhiB family transcriptional regulator [Streptomyces sp. 5-8]|uniref:Transcriptional regulator WhiB n=1 Tax=Streptomyces musisoli TaxID=2802280 RepID=A0ABS1P4T8_9ACTN|nr:WhiB family transcriptional regulator [Streptomyces musisoli]MBL1107375.1 WhiB family transcriptional regulator [Streptomyces musisoli]
MTSLHDLTPTTPGLPCRTTDPDLWFSKSSTERALAQALCRECPLQQPCAQYALDNPELRGVWGGTTAADRRQFWTGEPCRLDEFGRVRLLCGSERAYRAHFGYREQPCEECRAAHEEHVTAERRARLAEEHAAGGSVRGYELHRLLGEEACEACRGKRREKSKARRRAVPPRRGRARGTSAAPGTPGAASAAPAGAQPLRIAS